MQTTDNELLDRYSRNSDESAFRELVDRHLALAFSAAMRQAWNDHEMAKDITQAAFAELAHKAGKLRRHPVLAGWLYNCVCNKASSAMRAELRRQKREQEAMAMKEILT